MSNENKDIIDLYAKDDELLHIFKDHKKQSWGILNETDMMDMYPQGGYKIIGDLCKSKEEDTKYFLAKEEKRVPIIAYKGALKKGEYVAGYIPLEDKDTYVRVIKKKNNKFFNLLLMLVLFFTIFLGGLWLGQMNNAIDDPVAIRSGEMSNPNPENIRLPGIEKVYANAGDTHVTQLLLNVEGNAYNLQYIISLEDTGEVIYKSKVIEPGYGVKEFNMNRAFEEGEYPILITVNSSAQEESDGTENAAYNAGQLKAILVVE